MSITVIFGAMAVSLSFIVLWWAVSGQRGDGGAARLGDGEVTDLRTISLQRSATDRVVMPLFERIGAAIRTVTPSSRIDSLSRRLQAAGNPAGWSVERLMATRVAVAIVLGLLFLVRVVQHVSLLNIIFLVFAVAFGYYLPIGLIDRRATARNVLIRAAVSDTVDQLAVMVRAGLGLDAAITRVSRTSDGPLNDELARVVQDMRVGMSRGVALANLSERVDVPELRGVVSALAQAERLGVPVAQTLQVQATELRIKRRQLAEEAAMKLPVKILFPMVVCILPVLFIVVLGPAAIRIFEQLS